MITMHEVVKEKSIFENKHVEYHDRLPYKTMKGTIWTLPRTVTISDGIYRLDFVFDDVPEKLHYVTNNTPSIGEEVIVYSYTFYDYSKFDSRGKYIS